MKKPFKMLVENFITNQKAIKSKTGIEELFAVILQLILKFVNDNIMKNGTFVKINFINPVMIYKTAELVVKIVNAIILFKKDYAKFQEKYLSLNYEFSQLNNFLT